MNQTTVLRRGLTTATAALSALALVAPSASAATGPDVFAGTSEALALELRVTAPSELMGQITGGSDTLVQRISFTESALESSGSVKTATDLLAGLLQASNAASTEPGSGSETFQELHLGPVSATAGTIEWAADPAAGLSRSFSELAHVKVSLAEMGGRSVLPADVVSTVDDAVNTVVGQVDGLVGELNGALDQVEQTLEDTVGQVVDIPEILPTQVPSIPTDLVNTDLVEIRKMWSESVVQTVDNKVRSTAHSGIAEASLLGGLVEVPAFQYSSWAETAGQPGTADAGTEITHIAVRIADQEIALRDGKLTVAGEEILDLNDPALLGTDLPDEIEDVQAVLTEILNAAGLSVSAGKGTTDIAADGSSASATTSAFALSLAPLHAADTVDRTAGLGLADQLGVGSLSDVLRVELELLPTRAAVTAAPAPAAAPEPEAPNMPRTGGGAAAMLFGTLAMGGAALLRRKF